MSISPVITFKAGKCDADFNTSPIRVKPNPEPGFLYLYEEDDLYHFCWRARAATLGNPELDLMMVPTDGTFKPYLGSEGDVKKSPVKGRMFVLKFSSSSQRYFFWLQSREQPPGQHRQFSHRDLKLGQIVNDLLQGNEVDPQSELADLRNGNTGDEDDGDEDMQDAQSGDEDDATTSDTREAGAGFGGGSADGGRAAINAAVQNFLSSMQGGEGAQRSQKLFTTLAELLPSAATIPMIETADPAIIEDLLVNHLPAPLVLLEHQVDDIPDNDPDPETMRASVQALDINQQRDIVKRVLRSPQFSQGLMSLTSALRDGGLPSIAEALGVEIAHGGYTGPDRRMPLTGGDAVEAFLEGIKKASEKK